jgi:hypothetical protein
LSQVSRFFGAFRWGFMPLGLFALVAVGVHAAADLVDDRLLRVVEALDVWFDGVFAQAEWTASWVNRIDSRERTVIARALALAWELVVDGFIAVPALGYTEVDEGQARFVLQHETWRTLFRRLNAQPTPMRLVRPAVTLAFAVAGAYAVARLVESTLFVGLVGDVAPADVAQAIARVASGFAFLVVLASLGWRAVARALQHADAACVAAPRPWAVGWWGSVLALPLAVAVLLEAGALLSVLR